MDIKTWMDREINYSRPAAENLAIKEAEAVFEDKQIKVYLTLKNTPPIKEIVQNTCIRLLINIVGFIFIIFVSKFFGYSK